jgi:TolA-binding protein
MKKKFFILFVTCLISSFCFSQNAEGIFHSAANLYINGNNKGAKEVIDNGLKQFPNDPKLNELKAKIKDEEEKQDKKNQNQQSQNDQKDQQNQQQNAQQKQGQISKEDADRILNAIEQQEKDVLDKLDKQKAAIKKTPVEKEW